MDKDPLASAYGVLIAASANLELTVMPDQDQIACLAPGSDQTSPPKFLLDWNQYNATVAGSTINVAKALRCAGATGIKMLITIGDDSSGADLYRRLVHKQVDFFPLQWRERTNVSLNMVVAGQNGDQPTSVSFNFKGDYLPDKIEKERTLIEGEVRKMRPRYRVGTGVQLADAPIILTMFDEVYDGNNLLIQSTNVLNPGTSLVMRSSNPAQEEMRQVTMLQLLNMTDLLVLNEVELEMLIASFSVEDHHGLRKLLHPDSSFLEILVTRGKNGAIFLNHEEDDITIRACNVPTEDPTGAGDCFTGNFLAQLLMGATKHEALQFAAAAAALAVGKKGGSNMPTFEETQQFLDTYLKDNPDQVTTKSAI